MSKEKKTPIDFFGGISHLGGEDEININSTIEEEIEELEDESVEGGDFDDEYEDELYEGEESDEDEEEDEVPLDDEEEGDEEDLEGYTQAAILAKSFIEDGSLPKDFEISKDLTGADLKKALYDSATADLDEEAYFLSKGYTPKVLEMSKNIVNGVDPNLAYDSTRYEAISKVDLDENPEYAESILKLDYAEKGLDQETIDDLVSTKIERGEEVTEAKKAQKRFGIKAKEIIQNEQAKIKEQEAQKEKLKKQVVDIIKNGDISENITSSERKELHDYVYKPTELVEHKVGDKTVKNFVSKFKTDFDKVFSDPEEFVRFVYNLKRGWNPVEDKKSAKLEAAVNTIDALNRRVSNKSKKNTKKKSDDIFNNIRMISM